MNRRTFQLTALLSLTALSGQAVAETLHGVMFKNRDCTCCEGHAAYLKLSGIDLRIEAVDDIEAISWKAGIPAEYLGCHMILLEGYAIEGHVPVEIIRKLLTERPADVAGISIPGMLSTPE